MTRKLLNEALLQYYQKTSTDKKAIFRLPRYVGYICLERKGLCRQEILKIRLFDVQQHRILF